MPFENYFLTTWGSASEFFFLDFLWPNPQIINGRPLNVNIRIEECRGNQSLFPLQQRLLRYWAAGNHNKQTDLSILQTFIDKTSQPQIEVFILFVAWEP